MPENTINGHPRAGEIPIQFDPYLAPLDPNTPADAAPEPQVTPTQPPADLREAGKPDQAPDEPPDSKDEQEQPEQRQYFHRIRTVAGHRHTRTAVRHAAYVAQGAVITARQRRDTRSTARHERMMRVAESQGDHATALLWEERASKH